MESGLVFDIAKFSVHDGPGIRTTVFLQGCSLSCWWCHNPESQSRTPLLHYQADRCIGCETCVETCPEEALSLTPRGIRTIDARCRRCGECANACPTTSRELVGRTMSVAEVMEDVEKDRLFYDESGGGVTISGGEPLQQPEFLLGLLRACGERGIHRAVDTHGLASEETLLRVAEETDLFLYDVKMMDADRHRETTGYRNERILANLGRLVATRAAIHVRVPLIPGVNDDDENVDRTGAFLRELGGIRTIGLLPYHRPAKDKHERFGLPWRLNHVEEIPEGRVREISARFEEYGLRVEIGD